MVFSCLLHHHGLFNLRAAPTVPYVKVLSIMKGREHWCVVPVKSLRTFGPVCYVAMWGVVVTPRSMQSNTITRAGISIAWSLPQVMDHKEEVVVVVLVNISAH